MQNPSPSLVIRVSSIALTLVIAEILIGYLFFWTDNRFGAIHKAALLTVQYVQKRGNLQPTPTSTPIVYQAEPLPFYRPDPIMGFAPNVGRQTVTISHENKRHTFVATILPTGERATRHDDPPVSPSQHIWVFGDSWEFGWANEDEMTFPFILQSRMPKAFVRNFAFNGWGNTNALIKLRELKKEGLRPDIVLMGYATYYDERNVAAPSRLSGYKKPVTISKGFMPESDGYGHTRARLVNKKLILDMVPLFCEDNGLCNQRNPSEREQHEITEAVLTDARKVFPKARYLLMYQFGPDNSPVVSMAQKFGYEIIDLRPKTPYEWDSFINLDDHPGPLAHVAFANKIERAIKATIGNPLGSARPH